MEEQTQTVPMPAAPQQQSNVFQEPQSTEIPIEAAEAAKSNAKTFADIPPPTPPGYVEEGKAPTIQTEQSKNERNLYNSPVHSVMIRNFVSGFFRALGSVVVYLVLMAASTWMFKTYFLPELKPILETFESLGQMQSTGQGSGVQVDPNLVNSILQQIQPPPTESPQSP